MPRGPDVEVLDGKAIKDAKTGWVAALLTVMQAVLGFTPWRVTVDLQSSKDAYAVVTRNGRNVGSARIDATPIAANDLEVDTITMTAAFVLVTLSKGYRSGFEGLHGARDWRSVGWQYLASTFTDRDDAVALLTMAVDKDPGYLPAQLALRWELDRNNKDPEVQLRYVEWLKRQRDTLGSGLEARYLKIRMMHTAAAVTLNRLKALSQSSGDTTNDGPDVVDENVPPSGDTTNDGPDVVDGNETSQDSLQTEESRAVVNNLQDWIGSLPEDDPFRDRMKAIADVLKRLTDGEPVTDELDQQLASTTLDYDLACLYEHRNDRTTSLERLTSTMGIPSGRDEVTADPFFKDLVQSDEFKERFPGTPRTELLELDAFKPVAASFKEAGLTTATAVVGEATPDRSELFGGANQRLRRGRVALLACQHPTSLRPVALDIAAAMDEIGVRCPDDMNNRTVAAVRTDIIDRLREQALTLTAEQQDALTTWLDALPELE